MLARDIRQRPTITTEIQARPIRLTEPAAPTVTKVNLAKGTRPYFWLVESAMKQCRRDHEV